ncbi:MAG: hypothetical protein ACKVQJ_04730 [Pyrinomonadaceae bacterium]
MVWLKKFPIENILLDVTLVVAAFLLPNANSFLSDHLNFAFWIAAPLQIAALFCAFCGGGTGSGRKLPDWLLSAYVLNMILAVGSFIWLFLIAFAIQKQSGQFPIWGFRFAFFMAIFGGISAFGASLGMAGEGDSHIVTRFLLVLVVFIYLYFTESLLEVSIGISNPGLPTVVFVTFISYLPVRLVLAFQPPFSYWDLFSGIFCFCLFLSSVV